MTSSPPQRTLNINITSKVDEINSKLSEHLNQTKSSVKSKELAASKESGFDFDQEYSYEKIRQKYEVRDVLNQSVTSDV